MDIINKLALKVLSRQPKISKTVSYSRVSFDFYENNAVMYRLDGQRINWFFAQAKTKKDSIDTRIARRTSIKETIEKDVCHVTATYQQNDLKLLQHFLIEKDKPYFITYLTVIDQMTTESNELVPLDFDSPAKEAYPLFLSLEQKMLVVPYDNDMWVRYETAPLSPGKTSYDVTAIFDDKTKEGLIIGSLDHDVWKNGIRCSAYDARCVNAISGIADEGTHDHLSHGYLQGKEISSSRFVCGFYKDIREGLLEYGSLAKENNGIFTWKKGVPFGWNSYSALTLLTTIDHVSHAADFIHTELPEFHSEDSVTYINFDSVIGITKKQIRELVKELHSRNQKVGWYMNPLSHHAFQDNIPLRSDPKLKRKNIVLRNADGSLYPGIDNKYPIDITIPEAEMDLRLALREFVDLDLDYLKLDFLSHGAVEGVRYNKEIRTGRQALMYFYNIIKEELDPDKIHKEVFLSSSIDPLFPCGYSHSRRCSCDAFGHHEDVRYVLNALTYSFWASGTLYQYNDPDHTVLYDSLVDGRGETSENEARSRYNASVISGTVLLLSDNYGPSDDKEKAEKAKERARQFANNKDLNAIARLGKAFIPMTLADTSEVFYLHDQDDYLSVFNYEDKTKEYTILPKKIGFPRKGVLLDLNRHKKISYEKEISIRLKAYDSVILKLL